MRGVVKAQELEQSWLASIFYLSCIVLKSLTMHGKMSKFHVTARYLGCRGLKNLRQMLAIDLGI
jgi:hypothetical protein